MDSVRNIKVGKYIRRFFIGLKDLSGECGKLMMSAKERPNIASAEESNPFVAEDNKKKSTAILKRVKEEYLENCRGCLYLLVLAPNILNCDFKLSVGF